MIIVIGIAVYSFLDSRAFHNAADGAERSRSVVEQTQELLARLTAAETGQRGYLLTGDPNTWTNTTQPSRKSRGFRRRSATRRPTSPIANSSTA